MTNATTTTKTTLKYLDGTNGLIIRVIISIINTHTHTQIHSHAYTFNVTHHCQQFKSSQLFKKKKLEWTNRHESKVNANNNDTVTQSVSQSVRCHRRSLIFLPTKYIRLTKPILPAGAVIGSCDFLFMCGPSHSLLGSCQNCSLCQRSTHRHTEKTK